MLIRKKYREETREWAHLLVKSVLILYHLHGMTGILGSEISGIIIRVNHLILLVLSIG